MDFSNLGFPQSIVKSLMTDFQCGRIEGMALKDYWQQQRQERQQEVVQRQQSVHQTLENVRQERQIKAAQLQDDLSLFREMIVSEDRTRRINFQQFYSRLKSETEALLIAAKDRRQIQAKEVAEELAAFIQAIRQETAELLAANAADRNLMAQQVEQELAAFVEALRSDVQSYLWEMETIRKSRAGQLQRDLTQSRIDREAEMKEIFQRFADFRVELNRFHEELRNEVWGTDAPVALGADSPKPSAPKSPKVAGSSIPVKAASAPATASTTKQTLSNSVVSAKATKPSQKDEIAYEKDVYNYIHQSQGARLTQIEAYLGINRFQAVDALRSLIKKGLITQRDRVYVAHEDLVHA
jgi:hypothetical protein